MARLVKTNLDLGQNEIISFVVHAVGSDPTTPLDGQIWYRTDTDVLMLRAAGASVAISTAAGGIGNVVEDTTPALGGNLDVTSFALTDGLTRELVTFIKDASAINHLQIENEAVGNGPILRGTGDDTNVDLNFETKGTGVFGFSGDITVTGTVDGVDIAAEETRLQNTSGSNTGDEPVASDTVSGTVELATIAEVNTGTDATRAVTPDSLQGSNLQSKVDGISGTNTGDEDAAAEGTAGIAEIATQIETDAGTDDVRIVTPLKLDALDVTGMSWFIDEDGFGTDSASRIPSQQSVKAYVDGAVSGALTHKGAYNASTNTPVLDTGTPTLVLGDMYTVTVAGTFFTVELEIGDVLISDVDSVDAAALADWTIVQKNLEAATTTTVGYVELATTAEVNTGTDTTRAVTADAIDNSDRSVKLDAITGTNTGDEPVASDTVSGTVELATIAEVNTGTDATRAVTPDSLEGSALQIKVNGVEALADVTDATNVISSLDGASIPTATVAGTDKAEAISAVTEVTPAGMSTARTT